MGGGNVAQAPDGADWTILRGRLLAEPERLREDAGLLQALGLKLAPQNVVEFGPAALSRLEAARDRESSARQEIEATARANFAAQAQAHALAVDLLEAEDAADLARRVREGASARFGVATGALLYESAGSQAPAGWRALAPGLIDHLLGASNARMGACPALGELFGEDAAGVGSVALARLSLWNGRGGLLAFGAEDAEGFTPDMGAELVAFLARVVERTAARWPPTA